MDKFTDNYSINLSLLNLQELVSRIKNEKDFIRRREVIRKIRKNNLNIYPYLPIECISTAFKLDISEMEWIMNSKIELWKQIKIMADSETLDDYNYKLKEEGIDLFACLEFNKKTKAESISNLNEELDIGKKQYNNTKKNQAGETKYIEINLEEALGLKESIGQREVYEKKKMLLIKILNSLDISYNDEYIETTLLSYEGELTAYLLGIELYYFTRCSTGKCAGRNDLLDINHLLYLRSENDIIVSDDKIFDSITIFKQRISVEEFKKMFDKEDSC